MLAIKGGMTLAADLGLPVVAGGPLLRDANRLAAYFQDFRPSPATPEPYLVVNVDIAVARIPERARGLLLPEAWAYADSREVGEFRALRPVDEARRSIDDTTSAMKLRAVDDWMSGAIAGTPDQVVDSLTDLVERTGATALLANVSTHDHAEVEAIDEFLASL